MIGSQHVSMFPRIGAIQVPPYRMQSLTQIDHKVWLWKGKCSLNPTKQRLQGQGLQSPSATASLPPWWPDCLTFQFTQVYKIEIQVYKWGSIAHNPITIRYCFCSRHALAGCCDQPHAHFMTQSLLWSRTAPLCWHFNKLLRVHHDDHLALWLPCDSTIQPLIHWLCHLESAMQLCTPYFCALLHSYLHGTSDSKFVISPPLSVLYDDAGCPGPRCSRAAQPRGHRP